MITAAELTSTSSRPSSATTRRGSSRGGGRRRSGRPRSRRRGRPRATISSRSSSAPAPDAWWWIASAMPRPASAAAIARPSRRPAPVTRATRPRSSISARRRRAERSEGSGRSVRRGHRLASDITPVGDAPASRRTARRRRPRRRRCPPVRTMPGATALTRICRSSQLQRQAPGESGHRGLGRRVDRHRALRLEIGDRGEVDDAALGLAPAPRWRPGRRARWS